MSNTGTPYDDMAFNAGKQEAYNEILQWIKTAEEQPFIKLELDFVSLQFYLKNKLEQQ